MPTARELLEQADALMRRNRGGGDIPVLTDMVDGEPQSPPEIPVLTDRVEEVFVDAPPASPPALELISQPMVDGNWPDTIDPETHSVTGDAPDTLAVVAPVKLRAVETPSAEVDPKVPATLRAAGSEPTPPPAGSVREGADMSALFEPSRPAEQDSQAQPASTAAPDTGEDERWQTLADQISMQVLQRVDLFTDTGLKEQLAQHLKPIVARAGNELVDAINEQVGKLLRAYVAEAIEREIAQWRRDH